MPEPSPSSRFEVEAIRFALERTLASALVAAPAFTFHRASVIPSDPDLVRRRLFASALRLTPSMAPGVYAHAEAARTALGIAGEIEIYQAAGRENAALHLVRAPILLEIQGRMLALLDEGAALALFGHELGHWLAHGPWDEIGATALAAAALADSGALPSGLVDAARKLVVAREITADRFGLLACRSLDAALRLEMIATTGLAGDTLTWDTKAYLAQSREWMERAIAKGTAALATTHPEHSLRAWALWLFSESDVYRRVTAEGPGTRAIAEVDAAIAQALGAPALDLGYDGRDELPPFLYECGLAAGVLVAAADGVITDEERDALEDAFGRVVPGWAEVLDHEVALARYHETAPMVRAGGSDLVRSLFLLVTHVMGADDVVDAREVQMVLAIGESLGHLAEFRQWIRPTVAAIGAPIELDVVVPAAIPLPARAKEVHDAVDALCTSVIRRREQIVAPRRLIRMVGGELDAKSALARLDATFANRGITSTPPLLGAGLDERVRLVATVPVTTVEDSEVPLDASRTALVAAIARLRDELISGDGRSPSVRLRRCASGRAFDLTRLDEVRAGTAERTLQLVTESRAATLVTADDAGTHDGAARAGTDLLALHREVRDRAEETGANDLFLGHPILLGNVAPRGVTTAGYGVRAPLVLYPVELVRDGRGARGFSLAPRHDEEPVANASLLRLLFNKAGLALSDELVHELDEIAADPARGAKALLAKLREVGLAPLEEGTSLVGFRERDDVLDDGPPRLLVEECAVLGLFPQSSSDLLQDYDALLRDLEAPTLEVNAVLGAAASILPAGATPTVAESAPAVTVGWPVVSADPSQRAVQQLCQQNTVTVVDGPPGTGKSQLIVNLVADALRRGERVAVVAEKRAALDVVGQRLAACGLGGAVAVVHDVHEDRRALFEQIRVRLDGEHPASRPNPRLAILHQEYAQASTALASDASLLATIPEGAVLTVGQLVALVAGDEPALVHEPLAELDHDRMRRLLELVERIHPHRGDWAPGTWWRTPLVADEAMRRGSLHGLDDVGLANLGRQLRDAQGLLVAYEQTLVGDPVATDALLVARAGLTALSDALAACTTEDDARWLAALIDRGDADLGDLDRTWSERTAALVRWSAPTGLAVDDATVRDVAVLRSFAGRFGRVFSGLWWSTRGRVRAALGRLWPERAAEGFSAGFLDELDARLAASVAWARAAAVFGRLGLGDATGRDAAAATAAIVRLRMLVPHAAALRSHEATLAAVGLALPRDVMSLANARTRLPVRRAQLEALDRMRSASDPLRASFPAIDGLPARSSAAAIASGTTTGSSALAELCTRFAADSHRLREADGWWLLAEETTPTVRALLDVIATRAPQQGADDWRERVAKAWAEAHLARMRTQQPRLGELGTIAADGRSSQCAETMARLDGELRTLELEAIAARLADAELLRVPNAAYRARRTDDQKGKEALRKEVGKKSRLMPLRRFVREFADVGLLDVLPCWLLSPETMTVLFPREPLFDLVVFDEASQCTVESGLPVMLRAKRVVVAGDEKQMPPTSYFELGAQATDDDDRSAAEVTARDALSAESLLALARARCPHGGLMWHYRCRDESLIAFSNHAMYDGELLTIPSTRGPEAQPSVRWIAVDDGKYDAGLNRPEAERVVDLIAELLARTRVPTIGVVTFNLRQRQTILEAIESRTAADETFAERWQTASTVEAIDLRPFVKNLESVQGDERDVIIFSVGHAPVERTRKGGTAERYVPARFGPLGQRGGERRLNVAVSRAKAECYIVASFAPELLHTAGSMHDGPRLFKAYLEYAYELGRGRPLAAQRILDDVRGRPLRTETHEGRPLLGGHVPLASQIALALHGTPLRCELGMGSSRFRIPLAIGREGTGDLALAVLTDEGEGGVDPFERFVHRPAVLRMRGWDVMHVTATTWARRKADVLAEIRRRLG